MNEEQREKKHYLVTWKIDIEADSPEEAAAQALIIQRDNDPENGANFFDVKNMENGILFQDVEVVINPYDHDSTENGCPEDCPACNWEKGERQ